MDAEFERRRHKCLPPFDGVTLTLPDYVSLPLLQPILSIVVEWLFAYRPDAPLYRLLDWHEHDGYITEASPSSWQELRLLAASSERLEARFHLGDTYVREGFFPAERDYYLRVYVPDPDDNPLYHPDAANLIKYGTLDVSGPESLMSAIASAIEAVDDITIEVVPSETFFARSYGG
jgi:hypothetical protein